MQTSYPYWTFFRAILRSRYIQYIHTPLLLKGPLHPHGFSGGSSRQLRIGYVCNGSPVQEMGQIGGFPPGYWPRSEIWYNWRKKLLAFLRLKGFLGSSPWFLAVLGHLVKDMSRDWYAIKRWLEWIFSIMSCRMLLLDSSGSLPGNGAGDRYQTESRHTMPQCTCLKLIWVCLKIRGLKTAKGSCQTYPLWNEHGTFSKETSLPTFN